MTFLKRLLLAWAEWRGDDLTALKLSKEIAMSDLTKLDAAVDRAIAKVGSDAAALQQAAQDAADLQPKIDAIAAKIDSAVPAPAPAIDPNTGLPA